MKKLFVLGLLFQLLAIVASGQDKQVRNITPGSSGEHTAKTTEKTSGQHIVKYDDKGRLVLTTTKSKEQHLNSDNNSPVDHQTEAVSTISSANSSINWESKSPEYFAGVIQDIESRINSIKNNPVELEMAQRTGRLQSMELDLANAKASYARLLKNNPK